MICRMLSVLTLPIVLPALVFGSAAFAQENFRLLREKEIRARVIGKDITDASHWSTYFRADGALIRGEIGQRRTGTWTIQKNRIFMSAPDSKLLNCHEVWMSGENIRLRVREDEETFDAVVMKHQGN